MFTGNVSCEVAPGNVETGYKPVTHLQNLYFWNYISTFRQKQMHTGKHILFWILAGSLLVIGFGSTYGNYIKSFYFVTFLLPVAMATSYLFNYYLVPEYLLKRSYSRFALYTLYTIIGSLYLEMVIITLSFIVLANYNYKELDPIMTDIFVLASAIYFIVLLKAFLLLYRRVMNNEFQVRQLIREKRALKTKFITVRANRSNHQVKLEDIVCLESLSDYVKIHTTGHSVTTKRIISSFEESLPEYFIRIHRSYIVNQHHVTRYNSTAVQAGEKELPISRKYKSNALAILSSDE